MNIQKFSAATPSFGANLVNYLQNRHYASIETSKENVKSDELLERLDDVLPNYTVTSGHINGKTALKLESFNRLTGAHHAIQLYKNFGNETFAPEDVEVSNMERFVNKLEKVYGDTSPIPEESLVVSNPRVLENESAMEVMKLLQEKTLPKLEEYGYLKNPYSVEIADAKDEGKILHLANNAHGNNQNCQMFDVKENTKIIVRTTDKAGNPIQLEGFFYLPDDLHRGDDFEFWAENFERTIMDTANSKYFEQLSY